LEALIGGVEMDFTGLFSGTGLIALVCMVIGLGFVIFEMVTPGIGFPAIIGIVLLILGVVIYSDTVLQALILTIILLALIGISLAIVFKSASKGQLSRRLVLNESLDDDNPASLPDIENLIGKEGRALTPLKPSGTVIVEGLRLDVITEGEFLQKDSTVTITRIEGNKIVVKKIS